MLIEQENGQTAKENKQLQGNECAVSTMGSFSTGAHMPRKSVSGFAEAGAAMAQQLDDNDLLNLFSAIGRVVSSRFLKKRPALSQWQLVIDYLTSAMAFEPREQFRVLFL
jgi:DNA repair protein RadC